MAIPTDSNLLDEYISPSIDITLIVVFNARPTLLSPGINSYREVMLMAYRLLEQN